MAVTEFLSHSLSDGSTVFTEARYGRAQRFGPAERTTRPAQINGQPAFIVYVSGKPQAAMILHIRDGRVRTIYAVGDPDKLQTLPVAGAK